jgi:hypothetical protein
MFPIHADGIAQRSRATIAIVSCILLLPRSACAVLVATPPAAAPLIDFAQFAPIGRIGFSGGEPPFVIDALPSEDVLMRAVAGPGTVAIILGNHTPPAHPDNSYYLNTNGHWGPGRAGFLATGGSTQVHTIRIEFEGGPVSSVGGLFNYSFPFMPTASISALDENLAVIEQYTINEVAPISTPGLVDAGEFRGITRSQNDIYAMQITGNFVVVDDIRFFRIPEPRAILLSALAVSLLIARRTK